MTKFRVQFIVAFFIVISEGLAGSDRSLKEIFFLSEIDKTKQPAFILEAQSKEKRPLLVGLHTWSSDYKQKQGRIYAKWCQQNDWHFIHPNFRGPNNTPQALGSEYVISDIESAVEFMKTHYPVDQNRIYLIGVSGGGHASLLMAGRKPEIWAGVSAWCGISDVYQWWLEKKKDGPIKYAKHIEKACDVEKSTFKAECQFRSPLNYLNETVQIPLDIQHGIHDGRKGSVPFTHSMRAFNQLQNGKWMSDVDIQRCYESLTFPKSTITLNHKLYGKRQPVFRVICENARLTLFKGGHEIIHEVGLNWLNLQKKGQPAQWLMGEPIPFTQNDKDLQSGL